MRSFLVLSILSLSVAACSGGDNKSEAGNKSGGGDGSQANTAAATLAPALLGSTPAPAAAPSTSMAAAKDALAASGARQFTAGDPPATPEPLPGSGGALGSGCAPGAGALPDGAWFGHAVRWDASGIDFDLACFYVGDAASAQAAARKRESPPNGFLIVNDKKALRRVEVAPNAIGYRLADVGERIALEPTTYADLIKNSGRYEPCPAEWCPVWLFINAGAATEVMQQYVP